MSQKTKKSIASVSINYDDGTNDTIEQYALVGFNEATWFKVMLSPAKTADKVEMNNLLAELSKSLIASIEQDS